MEKAYAKLHGSYEALRSGSTSEALVDFTGGVVETFKLKEAPMNLFEISMKAFERHSMMACSLEVTSETYREISTHGLIRGHAYAVTRAAMVDIVTPNKAGKIPLLRLRNPWGNEIEWNGAMSDNSASWHFIPEATKNEIGLTFKNDGEFWMSYQDFLRHYDRLEICNLSPDSLDDASTKKWNVNVFEGKWVAGVTAGGCRNHIDSFHCNPQYVMTVEEPDNGDLCTVVVALMQKNRRSKSNAVAGFLEIGFAIYRVTEQDLIQKPLRKDFFLHNRSVARSSAFINLREASERFNLPPGQYLVIPSTYSPNEEGEFLIRVFSESRHTFHENDDTVGVGSIDNRVYERVIFSEMPVYK